MLQLLAIPLHNQKDRGITVMSDLEQLFKVGTGYTLCFTLLQILAYIKPSIVEDNILLTNPKAGAIWATGDLDLPVKIQR